MTENRDKLATIQAWTEIVIQRWEMRIAELGAMHSRELLRSFTFHVSADANGNPEKILFAFAYYGKFVDMGVGKGVPAGAVASSGRKPQPWHSKIFFGQVKKLGEILAEKYQMEAEYTIVENILAKPTT